MKNSNALVPLKKTTSIKTSSKTKGKHISDLHLHHKAAMLNDILISSSSISIPKMKLELSMGPCKLEKTLFHSR